MVICWEVQNSVDERRSPAKGLVRTKFEDNRFQTQGWWQHKAQPSMHVCTFVQRLQVMSCTNVKGRAEMMQSMDWLEWSKGCNFDIKKFNIMCLGSQRTKLVPDQISGWAHLWIHSHFIKQKRKLCSMMFIWHLIDLEQHMQFKRIDVYLPNEHCTDSMCMLI